ncbi:hypothetical protein GCM10022243_62600 [Saccharothrix violaceirubra]|uniref:DUF2975 family protein n=1 Tax=Saccharothrix violaceirubra TaxID=413306 RepID=A0A7W7WYY8_9PSEU|nr:hypothetical protein [Saccharothrix violaceirubra]MBB4968238.1 hypothetical protein [Saccharothrix violaceirubra]
MRRFTDVVRFGWAVTVTGALLGLAVAVGVWFQDRLCFGTTQGAALVRAGTTTTHIAANEVSLCLPDPTGVDRLFGSLVWAPTLIAYAVTFHLLLRTTERALREGPHSHATARGLRTFGWWLLLGPLAVSAVEFGSVLALVRSAVGELGPVSLRDWHVPWWAVVTGLGIVVLAGIMRTGAEMRLDLEGTV